MQHDSSCPRWMAGNLYQNRRPVDVDERKLGQVQVDVPVHGDQLRENRAPSLAGGVIDGARAPQAGRAAADPRRPEGRHIRRPRTTRWDRRCGIQAHRPSTDHDETTSRYDETTSGYYASVRGRPDAACEPHLPLGAVMRVRRPVRVRSVRGVRAWAAAAGWPAKAPRRRRWRHVGWWPPRAVPKGRSKPRWWLSR